MNRNIRTCRSAVSFLHQNFLTNKFHKKYPSGLRNDKKMPLGNVPNFHSLFGIQSTSLVKQYVHTSTQHLGKLEGNHHKWNIPPYKLNILIAASSAVILWYFYGKEVLIAEEDEEIKKDYDVLIINTGGTFSCVSNEKGEYETQHGYVEDWLKKHERYDQFNYIYKEIDPFIDSANATPKTWKLFGEKIVELVEQTNCKACVVIHGTDTLAYTAAILSFGLNLDIPIVLTGAQYPLSSENSDAANNLYGSCLCANRLIEMKAPNLYVFFNNKLFRGNRIRKVHANHFDAFQTVNCVPVGVVQGNTALVSNQYTEHLREKIQKKNRPKCYEFSENIALVRIHPGFNPQTLSAYKDHIIILQCYGTGNASQEVIEYIQNDNQNTYFACSECYNGKVDSHYSVNVTSDNCVSLLDMTPEAALAKASTILGNPLYKDRKFSFRPIELHNNDDQETACFEETEAMRKLKRFISFMTYHTLRSDLYQDIKNRKDMLNIVISKTMLRRVNLSDKDDEELADICSKKLKELFFSKHEDDVKQFYQVARAVAERMDFLRHSHMFGILIPHAKEPHHHPIHVTPYSTPIKSKNYSTMLLNIATDKIGESEKSFSRSITSKQLIQCDMTFNKRGEIVNEDSIKSRDSFLISALIF